MAKRFEPYHWGDPEIGIVLPFGARGEVDVICPRCTPERTKKRLRDLSVNIEAGSWVCHHCHRTGGLECGWSDRSRCDGSGRELAIVEPLPAPPREYTRPEEQDGILTKAAIAWLAERGISKEVAERNAVYSSERRGEVEVHFPYYRDGALVNVKHRKLPKSFRMEAGAERILYGLDDCAPGEPLVIVEGELDKLAIEEATGLLSVVSVPDGAPPPDAKSYASKFAFLDDATALAVIAGASEIILAVDADEPGRALMEELARRIGRHRCSLVTWPQGCKDANETLIREGKDAVAAALDEARAFPITGLVLVRDVRDRLLDLYEHGLPRGKSTGWKTLDKGYTVSPGQVTIVTGAPGSGKSAVIDALMVNMALDSNDAFGVFSPENRPIQRHVAKFASITVGKPFGSWADTRMSRQELMSAADFLDDRFFFIAPKQPTIASVLDVVRETVFRYGIVGVVLDPWNRFEHKRPKGLSETEYVAESLALMVDCAGETGAHIWIVAHPTKLQRDPKTGEYPVARPWDISGSAHWFNMADAVLSVWRDKKNPGDPVQVHVQKVRFDEVGELGMAELHYRRSTGRYEDHIWVPGEHG